VVKMIARSRTLHLARSLTRDREIAHIVLGVEPDSPRKTIGLQIVVLLPTAIATYPQEKQGNCRGLKSERVKYNVEE
jgi:hypothetical protein